MHRKKALSRLIVMAAAAAALVGMAKTSSYTAYASINSEAEQTAVSPIYQASALFKQNGISYNQFNSSANGRKYGSRFGYRLGVGRPEGVVIHETATPNASAWAEARYFNSNWTTAYTYVHAVVDDQELIELSDTNYGVWGAGVQANRRFIQIELCRVNTRARFIRSIANDASWIASMLYKYGLKPSRATASGTGTIWSHHDVSNYLGGTDHVDPDTYFDQWGYSMDEFYSLVKYYYNRLAYGTSTASTGKTSASVVVSRKSTVTQAPKSYVKRTVMATSRIYSAYGWWTGKRVKAGSVAKCYGTKWINGKKYYDIGSGRYVRTLNVSGSVVTLKRKAYIYNGSGRRIGWHYNRGSRIRVYGGTFKIAGHKYRFCGYSGGNKIYVRSGNVA